MKKIFAFIGILLSLLMSVACTAPSVSISPEEFNGEFTAYCFKQVYVHDKNDQRIKNEEVLIDSMTELKELRKDHLMEKLYDDSSYGYFDEHNNMVDRFDFYSNGYFTENVLIAIFVEAGTVSADYTVDSIVLDGATVNVVLNRNCPGMIVEPAMCYWCILVECKRVEGITSVTRQTNYI